jgi:hypothetical protein
MYTHFLRPVPGVFADNFIQGKFVKYCGSTCYCSTCAQVAQDEKYKGNSSKDKNHRWYNKNYQGDAAGCRLKNEKGPGISHRQ